MTARVGKEGPDTKGETTPGRSRTAQAAAGPEPVLHAVPPGKRRAGAAGRGEAGGQRGDGAGAGRAQAGRLRRFPERPGLPGATAGAPAPAGAARAARNNLDAAQPDDLPQQTREAADSLGRLLGNLETREGILDRRFYAVCEHGRMDELHGLLARGGLGVFPLAAKPLRLFWLSATLGGSPVERDEDDRRWIRRGQPPRHPHRRDPDPLAAPGQVAPLPGPRIPARD